MAEKLSIANWAEEDRPREKMMAKGASALTEAELLAILIGSGNTEESAVDLMRRLMADCKGSLNTLGRLTVKELTDGRYKGLGPAKAITILAACELGKRRMKEAAPKRTKVSSPDDLYELFRPYFMDLSHEECHVIFFNARMELLGHELISRGGMTEASVDVRILLRQSIMNQAAVVALAHNHPTGNCTPSRADDELTKRVKEACRAVGLKFSDHLVIADGDNNYYSYYNNGKL